MKIKTALLCLVSMAFSSAANAVVPVECAEAYKENGAIPGTPGCPFLAAAADTNTGTLHCVATNSEIYIPEYCGNLPEDSCAGAANKIPSILGNPINIATGHKLQRVTDYTDYALGDTSYVLQLVRYYNSNTSLPGGMFGTAWRSNFDRSVTASASTAAVVRPVGGTQTFIFQSGKWTPDSHIVANLVEQTNAAGVRTGWKYIADDLTVEQYDASGTLLSLTNRHGRVLNLTYQAGKLYRVTDTTGRYLEFVFDAASGVVRSVVDPAGHKHLYDYDAVQAGSTSRPRLASVRYPDKTPADDSDNPFVAYRYGEDAYIDEASVEMLPYFAFHLTGIVDENGDRYASFGYDRAGRATMTVHGTHNEDNTSGPKDNADRMDVVYDVAYGSRSTQWAADSFNSHGKQTHYDFDLTGTLRRAAAVTGVESPNCAAANSSSTFDSNGFSDQLTDWNGNVTDYDFNAAGLEISRTEALGKPEQRAIETDWYTDLRLPEEIREEGHTVAFTYEKGRVKTRIETDTTTHTVPYVTSGRTRQWNYTYSYHDTAQTQVASVTVDGPRTDVNDTEVYRYDTRGWLTEVTNSMNQNTRILEYNLRGQPVRIQDTNGVVTRLDYHPRGWLEKRTMQSVAGDVVTEYFYDDAGLLKSMKAPNGVTLLYGYDTAHRLRSVTNNAGETLRLTLDEFGNTSLREVRDASSAIQQLVRNEFDELGRLWKAIAPEGHASATYAYDSNNNPTRVANATGIPKTQAFDGLNRLTGIVDREQGNIQYQYDARNNLTKVTDQNNLETAYTVDGFGFVIQESSPDRGTIVRLYDAAGNLTEERSGRNIVTAYTYDALNRVKTMSVAGFPADGASYEYDETTTNGLPNKGIGKLTRITQSSGDTQSFLYDDRSNLVRVINKVGTTTQTIQYGYNLGSALTSIIYPSGRIVTYNLDNLGRPRSITTNENASSTPSLVVSDVTYKPFGPVSQFKYGNDLMQEKTYDEHYRIEDINNHQNGAAVLSLSYGYDSRGNIESITDKLETVQSQTLGYDDLSRLTSAQGGYGNFGFSYDPVGNRETVNWYQGQANYSETYISLPSQSNRLEALQRTGIGAFDKDFIYSGSGNLTGDGSRTFQYNGIDRLVGVNQGTAQVATYDHNALGQRTRKIVVADADANRLFHYDLAGRLLAEAKVNGDALRDYIYLNDMPIAVVDEDGGTPPREQTDIAVALKGDTGRFVADEGGGGGTVVFIATVANTSTSVAASVNLALTYPADVQFVSITPSSGACNGEGNSCDLGSLTAGASVTVRIVTRQAQPAKKSYTVTVSTSTAETSTRNNTVTGEFGDSCFIATAAFGSYSHPYLYVLRNFRDDILMQSEAGRSFVEFYYQNSPQLAQWIERHEVARVVTQVLLLPLIALAMFLQLPLLEQGFVLMALASCVVVWKKMLWGSVLQFWIRTGAEKSAKVLAIASQAIAGKSSFMNVKVWVAGALLCGVLAVPGTGWADTIYYIYGDNQNTPKVMTNQSRQVVWKGQYEPFGGVKESVRTVENNIRFPGQYFDQEIGLHYNYFRDYDAGTGRYVQSDPIGLGGGLNSYSYVRGNPVSGIDPFGLEVKVVATNPEEARILMNAYAKLNRTKRGMEICGELEKSEKIYKIKPLPKNAHFCPVGAESDPLCFGESDTIFIDPYQGPKLPTIDGPEVPPLPVVLGHELGHAIGDLDDGVGAMNNVNRNENPIRKGLGEPARTDYYVDEVEWGAWK